MSKLAKRSTASLCVRVRVRVCARSYVRVGAGGQPAGGGGGQEHQDDPAPPQPLQRPPRPRPQGRARDQVAPTRHCFVGLVIVISSLPCVVALVRKVEREIRWSIPPLNGIIVVLNGVGIVIIIISSLPCNAGDARPR